MTKEEIEKYLDRLPGHNLKAHGRAVGKKEAAAAETGFVKECRRCRSLKRLK